MDIDVFFLNVCRVCSNHLNNVTSGTHCLMANDYEKATTLATPLYETFGISITPIDGLPKHICSECMSTIQEVLQFKEKIQKADMKLRAILCKTYFENGKRIIKPDILETFLPESYVELNGKTEEEIEREMFESYFPDLKNANDVGIDEKSEKIVVEVKLENFHTEQVWESDDIKCNDFDSDTNMEVELFKSYFPDKLTCYSDKVPMSRFPKPAVKKEGKKRRRIRAYKSKWAQMKNNLNKTCKVSDEITDEFISEIECKVKKLVKRNTANMHSSNMVPRYMAVLEEGTFKKDGPVQCKICKKILSSVKSLALHSQIHFGFDFICEICGKGFPTYTALDQHNMTRHGKAKKISCELCDYKAINNMELKIHERTHTGERPFVCDICGRDFHRRRCLVNHKYRHTNIKNYKCEICSKAFISASELKDHCNNVHERRYLYGCHLCETTYAKICSVRSHLVSAHGLPRNQQGKVLRVNVTQ